MFILEPKRSLVVRRRNLKHTTYDAGLCLTTGVRGAKN
jgi:hypothetical protein